MWHPVRGIPDRTRAMIGLVLFISSLLFPLAASTVLADPPATWIGVADVAVAAALVLLGMTFVSRAPSPHAASAQALMVSAFRGLANVVLLLLVVYFVAGEHVRWSVLLVGLAWRAWLLVFVLPGWIAAWSSQA